MGDINVMWVGGNKCICGFTIVWMKLKELSIGITFLQKVVTSFRGTGTKLMGPAKKTNKLVG